MRTWSEWTGLDGKQGGSFLRRFAQAYPSEILSSMSGMEPEAIRAAVEAFPRED